MGNIIGYLVLLTLCTGAALLMDNILGSLPLYLLVFVLFFSLGYTFRMQRKFRFTLTGGGRTLPRGVSIGMTAAMHNDSGLPFCHLRAKVQTGARTSEMDFSLSPRETRRLSFAVRPPHVGPYVVGVPQVRFYDPLGLFSLVRRPDVEPVTVVPRIVDIVCPRNLAGPPSEMASAAQPVHAAGPDSYNGVREYQTGDSLRHIHWKLTAHTARYMSRRYETTRRDGVTVCIDRERPGLPETACRAVYDCVTEAGLSVAAAALRQHLLTEIVSSGPSGTVRMPLRSRADLEVAAVEMGSAVFGGGSLAQLLEAERTGGEGNAALVVCAAGLGTELVGSLAALAAAGRRPVLVYAMPEPGRLTDDENRTLGYLAGQGVPWRAVASAEELRAGLFGAAK